MPYFRFRTSRVVADTITGDFYEDWKKTIGDRPDIVNSIGHKLVMVIENKPYVMAYLKPDDVFEGELHDFIIRDFNEYVSAGVFTALAEKTVEAFYELDVNNDESAFYQKLGELQGVVRELLDRSKSVSDSVSFTVSADALNRTIQIELVIGAVAGWGSASWSESPWGS